MTEKIIAARAEEALSRIRRWAGIITNFACAQGFAQFAGMVSGLIFVRWMPVNEYALYAIGMTALTLVTVGSDLGLNGALSYFWRQGVAQHRQIDSKIVAVRKLRSLLFLPSLVLGIGVLLLSNVTRSAPVWVIVPIISLVGVAGWLQVRNGVGLALLRLEGRQSENYYCEIAGNIMRLIGAACMIVFGLTKAWFGIMIGLVGTATVFLALGIFRRDERPPREPAVVLPQDWDEIRSYMLPVLPSIAVSTLQGPLVLWFTAQRVGISAVAEVYALSRLAAILALAGTFVYIVLIPRLSRISDERRFVRTLVFYFAGLSCLAILAVIFVAFVPQAPLWLIGSQYAHLEREILLAVCAVAVATMTSLIVLSNRLRGWVALDPFFSPIQLTLMVALCAMWDFSSTLNVVVLNLTLALCAFSCAAATFCIGILLPALITARVTTVEEPRL